MADSGLRQRQTTSAAAKSAGSTPIKAKRSKSGTSFVDVVRVLATIAAAGLALSYYMTSGESYFFGHKPWWTDFGKVKNYLQGPQDLTLEQLAKYDGTNPDLPIYIAINGTIYDVSASPHMYGPGGGYSVFAGRDATRAFVTGCFKEDHTDDLRGAEEVYLLLDDPNEQISSAEKKTRAEKERREAKKKVLKEVKKWVDFYGTNSKYSIVGKVANRKKPTGPPPPLCEYAQQGRKQRNNPHGV